MAVKGKSEKQIVHQQSLILPKVDVSKKARLFKRRAFLCYVCVDKKLVGQVRN